MKEYPTDLQNWSLTIRRSLVSYPGYRFNFLVGSISPSRRYSQRIQSFVDKFSNIYNVQVWFGWVGFYGISTIVGRLMTNSLNTYILNIYY